MVSNDPVFVSGIICLISSRRIAAAMVRFVRIILGVWGWRLGNIAMKMLVVLGVRIGVRC